MYINLENLKNITNILLQDSFIDHAFDNFNIRLM